MSVCKENKPGRPVNEEDVCRFFKRIAQSLIEEPEVCEWCESFENGFCFRESE